MGVANPAAATSAATTPTTQSGKPNTTVQTPGPSTVPVSLHSTNPTAIPLASLVSNMPTQATVALSSSAKPGASPPISGAPPLPTFVFKQGVYPALDAIPPLDSPQVKQWIADVANSGVAIPNIPANVAGGCVANAGPAKNATDKGTCWWTCGGCTRETDVTTCPDKMTWGLSFDDGPSPYTSDLVNYLGAQSPPIKSTLFVVGSRAISRPDILQESYMSSHQLSVHTWSHPTLTTLTNEQIIAELGWTRQAIKDITGVAPNTMRPPYGDIDDRVRAICKAMGLTPIIWTSVNGQTFDTDDWHIGEGTVSSSQVLAKFTNILNLAPTLNTGFIVLSHDLYQQSVDLAIGYYLPDAIARGTFALKPIITCLGKNLGDAYVIGNGTSSTGGGSSGGSGGGSGSGSNGVSRAAEGGIIGAMVGVVAALLI